MAKKRTKRAATKTSTTAKKKRAKSPAPKLVKRAAAAPKKKPVKRRPKTSLAARAESAALIRDRQIVELSLRGKRSCEIAEALAIDGRTVRRSLARTRGKWRDDLVGDFAELVAEAITNAKYLKSLAFEAYEESRIETVERITRGPDGATTMTETRRTRGIYRWLIEPITRSHRSSDYLIETLANTPPAETPHKPQAH